MRLVPLEITMCKTFSEWYFFIAFVLSSLDWINRGKGRALVLGPVATEV